MDAQKALITLQQYLNQNRLVVFSVVQSPLEILKVLILSMRSIRGQIDRRNQLFHNLQKDYNNCVLLVRTWHIKLLIRFSSEDG